MVLLLLYRTIEIFNQKMEGFEEENQDEDEDHGGMKKMNKKKRYATPVAEFIDVFRDKLKMVAREFKF